MKLNGYRSILTAAVALMLSMQMASAQVTQSKPWPEEITPTVQVPATFRHPGLLHSMEELDFVKKKIVAGEEPWKSNFEKMKNSRFGSLDYKPTAFQIVKSGIGGSGGKEGGAYNEGNDSHAAYAQALLWAYTGDERYAEKAVEILNAWGRTLEDHQGANWYLTASWAGSTFPQAAEIIRYTYPKWKQEDIKQFSNMLNKAFLRILHGRLAYGNREMSTCNALMAIGVFNNDKAAYYEGLSHLIDYVPCFYYLTTDGPKPRKADYWTKDPSNDELYKMHADLFPNRQDSYLFAEYRIIGEDKTMMKNFDIDKQWNNPGVYLDGLTAETCRDLGHVEMAFGGTFNCFEIAWHQGQDLYTPYARRIITAMEFNNGLRLGAPVPAELKGGKIVPLSVSPTFEIAYNHYHNRMGFELPKTKEFLENVIRKMKAEGYTTPEPPIVAKVIWNQTFLHMSWETLTHAEIGDVEKKK